MSIWIDTPRWHWHGRRWSHLISDTSLGELHDFAAQIPLRYLSFGRDHYDVPEELHERALALGADHIDPRDLVRRLRQSGLRLPLGKEARTWRRTLKTVDSLPADVASSVRLVAEVAEVGLVQVGQFDRSGERVFMVATGSDFAEQTVGLDDRLSGTGIERVITTSDRGFATVELLYLG